MPVAPGCSSRITSTRTTGIRTPTPPRAATSPTTSPAPFPASRKRADLMSTLKFTRPEDWTRIEQHLAGARGARFAFALTKTLHNGQGGPVLEVVDVIVIDDTEIEPNHDGWYLSENALDAVHNRARSAGRGLVEFHNHRAGPPGVSSIDERA